MKTVANMADYIEQYLREQVQQKGGVLELQRAELAERFRCVPSQINYVLATRFTPERGFLVESRRGGGGYIRITRLRAHTQADVHRILSESIGPVLPQVAAADIVARLHEEGFVTDREAAIMDAAMRRETIAITLPDRDLVRANLLKAMLMAILRF